MNGQFVSLEQKELEVYIQNINASAKALEESAEQLSTRVKELSAKGIIGVEWFDQDFMPMLRSLQSDKITEAGKQTRIQAEKLAATLKEAAILQKALQ